jgi:hypothetical protein
MLTNLTRSPKTEVHVLASGSKSKFQKHIFENLAPKERIRCRLPVDPRDTAVPVNAVDPSAHAFDLEFFYFRSVQLYLGAPYPNQG